MRNTSAGVSKLPRSGCQVPSVGVRAVSVIADDRVYSDPDPWSGWAIAEVFAQPGPSAAGAGGANPEGESEMIASGQVSRLIS